MLKGEKLVGIRKDDRRALVKGQKFKMLTVIRPQGRTKSGNKKYLCQCDCGNTTVVTSWELRKGSTKSCGCVKHRAGGLSKTSQYRRGYRLLTRYGLGPDDYDRMVLEQNSVCVICGLKPNHDLQVDHCHLTGKVRQLLCTGCNVMVGLLEVKPDQILAAQEYIKRHK